MSLPAADDLFRPTAAPDEAAPQPTSPEPEGKPAQSIDPARDADPAEPDRPADKQPSGRVRHDEKMTVYVTAEELLDLEQARLRLRVRGVSVDRGRLVREAVAIALADFEANGDESLLVRRLTGS